MMIPNLERTAESLGEVTGSMIFVDVVFLHVKHKACHYCFIVCFFPLADNQDIFLVVDRDAIYASHPAKKKRNYFHRNEPTMRPEINVSKGWPESLVFYIVGRRLSFWLEMGHEKVLLN